MEDFPVVAGIGPAKSYVTYAVTGAQPTFHIAYDNYGINCGANIWGTAIPYTKSAVPGYYYSWIFIAPTQGGTGTLSVNLQEEAGWTGDNPVCQLYGGWVHNIDSNPTTDPNNWVALGSPVTISTAGLHNLVTGATNIYPAYVIELVSASGVGVVDWQVAGA